MEILCDASELTAIYGAEAPDTFLVAGFSIPRAEVSTLITRVAEIKNSFFGNSDVPIKWNVKDLERALVLHNATDLAQKIRERSNEIRKSLLESLSNANATLFLSVILAYSNDRQVLGETKDDLVRYAFGNFLMRTGLFCKERNSSEVQLILDWPDKEKRQLFVEEFFSGWKDGKSGGAGESVPYRCGPLRSLGYRPGPLFGVTDVDVRLQLADLLVGACRSFINFCMGRVTAQDFGVQQFKAIAPRLDRIDSGKCFGRGVTVAPTKSDFSALVLGKLNELDC